MNEIIKIDYSSDRPTVSARELHEFLGVETPFRIWFPRMAEYGFTDGSDYTPYIFVHPQNHQETTDYQLTIDMAKEICMLQRNERGKQARQYFIQLEKDWNSPEKVMARALQIADRKIKCLQTENAVQKQLILELKSKADYTDCILKNKGLVSINQIAKDYGMSARSMNNLLHDIGIQYKQGNQWLLYSKYQRFGYTHSETYDFCHSDGRRDIAMTTKWTQKGRLFLYQRLKTHGVLPMIEKAS